MIRHSRLTALGILLCVLSALFAVEAKIAWFSPAGSASAQFSCNKACPVEAPKHILQRSSSPTLQPHDFAGVATLFAVTFLLASLAAVAVAPAPFHLRVTAFPGFSAALFLRPPPVR